VVSPGVPLDLPLFTEAERRGIPIVAEVELGFAVARAPIVAVTGTNGKSTTVEPPGANRPRRRTGRRKCSETSDRALREGESVPEEGLLVVRESSFQLSRDAVPSKVGILLNVTPITWTATGNMERYAGLKARLFQFQNESEFRVPASRRRADSSSSCVP